MMSELAWVALIVVLLPVEVYLAVKAGTIAYLRGRQRFEELIKEKRK